MSASKNPKSRLEHIQFEIKNLTQVLEGLTYQDFVDSYVTCRACEHALLIISEAVRALPADMMDRYPGPDWADIRGIGNFLRHEYYNVNTRLLWDIVTTQLPALAPVIDAMIEDMHR